MTLNPYLIFDTNCREAFEFYRAVFGGEFSEIHTLQQGRSRPAAPFWSSRRTGPTAQYLASGRFRIPTWWGAVGPATVFAP